MSPAFDPYHVWLGIPPQEQPPDHYRLLGIARFEDDPEVIEQAAERQLEFLRQQLATPHRELALQLQKEVHLARQVLLDPSRKMAYDLALRESIFHRTAEAGPGPSPSSPEPLQADSTRPASLRLLLTLATPVLFFWNRPTLTSLLAALIVLSAALFVALSPVREQQTAPPSGVAALVEGMQPHTGQQPAASISPQDTHAPRSAQTVDSQTNPQTAPVVSSPLQTAQNPPASVSAPSATAVSEPTASRPLVPGLIGRLTVNREDVGVILRYLPGESFSQAVLDRLISQYGLSAGDQQLVLSGIVRVQCPSGRTALPIHVKLTTEPGYLGVVSVQIDGRPIPIPTDSQEGTFNASLVLTQGDHPITCQLQGKEVGNIFRLEINPLLGVTGPQTTTPSSAEQTWVNVGYTQEDLTQASELPTLARHSLNDELGLLSADEMTPGRIATKPTSQPEPTTPPAVAANQGRKPVPLQTDLLRAKEEIRAKYRKDLQEATAPAARSLLARTMLQEGNAETDPPRQYMLYEEARELAITAGDPDLAVQAGEAIALVFDVDPWPMHLSAVNQLAKAARSPQTRESVVGVLVSLCDSALAEDRYDVADNLLDLATNLASQLRDPVRREQFSRRREDTKAIATAFEAIKPRLEVLKQNPDDAQANEAVGRFYCFVKHDWKKGLPYLAKAETVLLRTVAQSELNRQVGAAARLRLADDWWAIGETLSETEKSAVRRHAGYYYLQCAGLLSGEAAQRANSRLAESGRVIDLLALAANRRATVVGNWQIGPKALVSSPEPTAQIAFPIAPPPEYDLVVEIQSVPLPPPSRGQGSGSQRPDPNLDVGRGAFAAGLIQGRRQFLVVTDFQIPNQGIFSFLADYDKKGPDPANPTFRPMVVTRSQRATLIVYSVKKTGLTVTANGTPIIQYNGDYTQLSMPQGWNAANQPRLFFATRLAIYRITRAELQDTAE